MDALGQGVCSGYCHVLSRSSSIKGLLDSAARGAVLSRQPLQGCLSHSELPCLMSCPTQGAHIQWLVDTEVRSPGHLVPAWLQRSQWVGPGCLWVFIRTTHFPLPNPDSFSILPQWQGRSLINICSLNSISESVSRRTQSAPVGPGCGWRKQALRWQVAAGPRLAWLAVVIGGNRWNTHSRWCAEGGPAFKAPTGELGG